MEIDLQQFCSTDPGREYLHQPWSRGDWTYSSNGHIGIRVTRRTDVPENEKAPDLQRLLDKANGQLLQFEPPPVVNLPKRSTKIVTCRECEGDPVIHTCPDCTCVCDHCDGTGKETTSSDDSKFITIRNVNFALKYARQLLALPNILLPDVVPYPEAMAFRFDGGDGILMPMTATGAEPVVKIWPRDAS